MAPKRAAATKAAKPKTATGRVTKAAPKTTAVTAKATKSKAAVKTKAAESKPKAKTTTKPAPKKAAPKKAAITSKPTSTTTKAATAKAAAKDAPAKDAEKPVANMKRKREAISTEARPAKKAKVVLNKAPTQKLDVYVCGEGGNGELGLGNKKATNVKRPRLNQFLSAGSVGVVQLATGGMHGLALTHDNKIFSWGVNDAGTLGRNTSGGEVLKDMDKASDDGSGSDSDSESGALNEKEATPAAIPSSSFPDGTVIVQIVASDSASFALTDEGLVYGWGNFRDSNGTFGFRIDSDGEVVKHQDTPVLIDGLKNITQLATGADHIIALDKSGNVFAWGVGEQGQLARRHLERRKYDSLKPAHVALPRNKVAFIGCGTSHTFAVLKDGSVYSWGLNNMGQCGVSDNVGEDNASIFKPVKVKSFDKPVSMAVGGNMHSIALTTDGDCLVFGRCDSSQAGMDIETIPEDDVIINDRGKRTIISKPTKNPAVPGKTAFVASGSEHCIAITEDGQAYSWGFNSNFQCGQGDEEDDIDVATLIDNTAVRGKKLVWAGAGGQYSAFGGAAGESK